MRPSDTSRLRSNEEDDAKDRATDDVKHGGGGSSGDTGGPQPTQDDEPTNNTTVEYIQLCESMRHYSLQRFAALTFFVTSNGILFARIHPEGACGPRTCLLPLVGLLLTFVFWRIEERAADHFQYFRERAGKLEKVLHFKQFTIDRKPKLFTEWLTAKNRVGTLYGHLRSATSATRLLYGVAGAYWLFLLIKLATVLAKRA